MYSIYSQIKASHFSAGCLKVKKTSEHYSLKLRLSLLVAVMNAIVCRECLTEISGKKFRNSFKSFRCYFSFILSHTYLRLYSVLAKRKEIITLL